MLLGGRADSLTLPVHSSLAGVPPSAFAFTPHSSPCSAKMQATNTKTGGHHISKMKCSGMRVELSTPKANPNTPCMTYLPGMGLRKGSMYVNIPAPITRLWDKSINVTQQTTDFRIQRASRASPGGHLNRNRRPF